MNTINQPFEVNVAVGTIGYTLPVVPSKPVNSGSMMCISTGESIIYITKQQAMDFFGLKDPMGVRHNLD